MVLGGGGAGHDSNLLAAAMVVSATKQASLAQQVEQALCKRQVPGSSPGRGSTATKVHRVKGETDVREGWTVFNASQLTRKVAKVKLDSLAYLQYP